MADERALSVTEAMGLAKQALESVRLRVVGEVSEFNDKPGYKAAYFTVADGGSAMPCLMWRDSYAASGIQLRCGMLVELTGQFSAYVPKGRMQFTVRRLALAGEGRLRMEVAQLAARLEAEGLMRPERKRPLPRYPGRIAVVTSPRGKAVHDVLLTLQRRYPLAEVVLAGVQVEGDGAVDAIVEGLRIAREACPDVILLVRGGGSYEDLMPFNHEAVARSVVAPGPPVVSGIGHEPDTSIADMVADLRASTPTAAAEACAPSIDDLEALVTREQRALARALEHRTHAFGVRLKSLASRPVLSDPHTVLGPAAQTIDLARLRLERALPDRMARDGRQLEYLRARMVTTGPRMLDRKRAGLGVAAAGLEALSPLSILSRGFSATFKSDQNKVVSSVSQVSSGDEVVIRVQDGRIAATVTSTQKEER